MRRAFVQDARMARSLPTFEDFVVRSRGHLPGLIGIEITGISYGRIDSRLPLRDEIMAPNGYLHAATVVALADTSAGYGCIASLPDGAENFTTMELKTNFIGTARTGTILCVATLVHGGRTTQVWDSLVTDETSGKTIALFRCTQMILYPAGGEGTALVRGVRA